MTGTSRTLTISEISVTNGDTVSVAIASPREFTISGSPKTVVVYRAFNIGMAYQGGRIAYIYQSGDSGYVPGQTHGLIASTADLSTGIEWKNGDYTTTGAAGVALGTGQANTTTIVNNQGEGSYAAKICNDYTNPDTGTGVYSDWYLPSRDELEKLYLNKAEIGGFTSFYWTSSEKGDGTACGINFFTGEIFESMDKRSALNVRAVRSF